jgi:hypothetical protein
MPIRPTLPEDLKSHNADKLFHKIKIRLPTVKAKLKSGYQPQSARRFKIPYCLSRSCYLLVTIQPLKPWYQETYNSLFQELKILNKITSNCIKSPTIFSVDTPLWLVNKYAQYMQMFFQSAQLCSDYNRTCYMRPSFFWNVTQLPKHAS